MVQCRHLQGSRVGKVQTVAARHSRLVRNSPQSRVGGWAWFGIVSSCLLAVQNRLFLFFPMGQANGTALIKRSYTKERATRSAMKLALAGEWRQLIRVNFWENMNCLIVAVTYSGSAIDGAELRVLAISGCPLLWSALQFLQDRNLIAIRRISS